MHEVNRIVWYLFPPAIAAMLLLGCGKPSATKSSSQHVVPSQHDETLAQNSSGKSRDVVATSSTEVGRIAGDKLLMVADQAGVFYNMPMKTLDEKRAYLEACRDVKVVAENLLTQTVTVGSIREGQPVYQRCRPLLRLFSISGQLAIHDSQWEDATLAGLTLVRLGIAVANGGEFRHHEFGWVCIGFGIRGLAQIADRVSEEEREGLIRNLAALESQLESVEDAISRTPNYESAARTRHKRLEKVARAELALCLGTMLVENCRTKQGSVPDNLSLLLKCGNRAPPIDPISGLPFVLKRDASPKGYILYSVGFDGKDDGGNIVERHQYILNFPDGIDFTILSPPAE